MLKVDNLRVRSFDVDHLDIHWELSGDDPRSFTLEVLRSENQFGPFVPITKPFKDRSRFRDSGAGIGNYHRVWFYKIKVTRATTGDGHDGNASTATFPKGPGVGLLAAPDLEGLEMARLERLRLQEFKGRLVWVFPIRTTGTRCTCFDPVTRQRLRSSCLMCFDTGIVGGFYNPMQVYMEIVNPIEQTQLTPQAELKPQNTLGRLANWPYVHERFIVVEAENIRWRLAGPIKRIGKLRATVRQEFSLHRLPPDDVAYKLPVILDPKDLEASPDRQFSNPQNLENAGTRRELTEVGAGLMVGLSAAGDQEVAKVLVSTTTNGSNAQVAEYLVVALVGASHPSAATAGIVLADADGGTPTLNQLSDIYGVTKTTALADKPIDVVRYGRAKVRKASSETWEVGDRIYLTTTAGKVSKTPPAAEDTWIAQLGYAAEGSTGDLGTVDIIPGAKVQN